MELTLLKSQLFVLAKNSNKPTAHAIDLGTIYRETRDLKNREVAKTVKKLYKHHYRHGTDRKRWDELSKLKINNYVQHTPQHTIQLFKHFIKELKLGRYIVDSSIRVHARIPFFIKDEKDNKYRFIPDYSYPKDGVSVNSLVYASAGAVELNDKYELVNFAYNNGTTKWMGKNDYKSWYRQIPMANCDWGISVYHFCGIDFIDTRMPWGTRTASRIAHHMSVAIAHISYKYIPRALVPCCLNYIDDHIFRAPSEIEMIYIHVVYILVCLTLGVQINIKKTILAAQIINALGYELDVIEYEVAVTKSRNQDITLHLIKLYNRPRSSAHFGQKVAGKCEDVSFILYPLRVYLRHLRNAIPAYNAPVQEFRVTPQIKTMCVHWIRALHYLHHRKMSHILNLPTPRKQPLYTDASNQGFGLYYNGHWLYGEFEPYEVQTNNKNNICERELFPVLIAAKTFGSTWTGSQIILRIDNQSACQAIINKDIRNLKAHALLVRICETMMRYQFEFTAIYIPTDENSLADQLSRLDVPKFKQLCQAQQLPCDSQPTRFHRPKFITN